MWQQTNCIMSVYDICIEILNGGIMGAFLILYGCLEWKNPWQFIMDAEGC